MWFVHSDGRLVGLTYDRANAAIGWHDHTIGGTSAHATITVSDFANIAVGTTLILTKSDGTTVTFTSEAVGSSSPSSSLTTFSVFVGVLVSFFLFPLRASSNFGVM